MATTLTQSAYKRIEAYRVPEHARMSSLPRHFGRRMMDFEGAVYESLREIAPDYDGGFWHMVELSNRGFYMWPEIASPARVAVDGNGYDGHMSAEAVGITACLFALSRLSFGSGGEVFAEHFHRLRDFAGENAEAPAIFAATD